jgi:hypothetical protein
MNYYSVLFLTNFLLNAILAIIIVFVYVSVTGKNRSIGHMTAALGFFYALTALLNLNWFLKGGTSNTLELLLLDSMFLAAKTTLLIIIIANIVRDKKLIYLLVLYLFAALTSQFSFTDFFIIVQIISLLLSFMAFLYLGRNSSQSLRASSFFGLLYSACAFIIVCVVYFLKLEIYHLQSFSLVFLSIGLYYVFRYFRSSQAELDLRPVHNTSLEKAGAIVRMLASLIIINLITVVTVISLHEMGHAGTAAYFRCEIGKAVIFDAKNLPHTEVYCSSHDNDPYILLAGLFVPVILGLVLLLIGEGILIDISYLVVGFSFYFSNKDITDLGLTGSFVLIMTVISFVFLFLGIRGLVISLMREENLI